MIEVIATRRTTLNGTTYEKDAALRMPLQQFQDLEFTGRFRRAKAATKATATPARTKSKVAVSKASAPAEPAVESSPVQSGTSAD